MKATEKPILKFLEGPKQFRIPIFQRRYSWDQKDCDKLWKDVLAAGRDDVREQHFLGSIVYIRETQNMENVSKFTVIDGQQRLTTISLLLLALKQAIEETEDVEIDITPEDILNDYLFNDGEEGEFRLKLHLTKGDIQTFDYLLNYRDYLPANPSLSLEKNFRFFKRMIKDVVDGKIKDAYKNPIDVNLQTVHSGLKKLMIVEIILEGNENSPQTVFESLNSTGVPLSQADLIRNYVILQAKSPAVQNRLYRNYWFEMEEYFGKEQYTESFNSFMRDYLTLKTEKIPPKKGVYNRFKTYLPPYMFENSENAEKIVSEIRRYGRHYVDFTEKEKVPEILECLEDIWELRATVIYPFLLEVYDYYKRGDIEESEVIKTLQLVESYVFRRSICGLSGKFLNQIFVSILKSISMDNANNYIQSLNAVLLSMPFHRRCPNDDEFKKALWQKDIYTAQSGRVCKYMLRKLENDGHKEPINVDEFTIEHVMPQKLTSVWKRELGENHSEIHDKFLHTIGNLTLTGYNTEYSNSHFKEKRDMEKGFRQSHLYLNESLARAEQWNLSDILTRAKELTEKACKIWIYPEGDDNVSIEENSDFPSSQQKIAAKTSITPAGYGTSSNLTSMANWSKWERELGWIIIEMLEYRDPSGLMIFEPKDI